MKTPRLLRKKSVHLDIPRKFYVNGKVPPSKIHEEIQQTKFVDNTIRTAKYTLLNFLPKNLFEQFRRIANFYFLCLCIIHFSIDSPVSPLTSLLPLMFVVTVTGIKQGYEDSKRHRQDNKLNKSPSHVLRDDKLQKVERYQIKVGDVVKVHVDEEFPCDLLFLASSDPKFRCEVTTANLDGETNLKTFYCPFPSNEQITESELSSLSAAVECQHPHPNLYDFKGRLDVFQEDQNMEKYSLGTENLLLRGARLKNTHFIYGCAVYTGTETKVALNSKLKANKFSTAERTCNYVLVSYLGVLIAEVILISILKYIVFGAEETEVMWYLGYEDVTINAKTIWEDSFSFFILFSYIIPISLYVTLEMQKFLGTFFFQWDEEMLSETGEGAICNTSDLNEELGQIQYLFTDKTGTLTENLMQFRQCSIGGVKFFDKESTLKSHDNESINPLPKDVQTLIESFLLTLCLCHTVQRRKVYAAEDEESAHEEQNEPTESFAMVDVKYEYQASSPDEKALVEACAMYGVVFEGEIDDQMHIYIQGEKRIFEKLEILEFDSDRKMMSVLIRDLRDGQIWVVSKGAESSVLKTCHVEDSEDSVAFRDITMKHIDDFARAGLRTLAVARKQISNEDYEIISKKLILAKEEIENREKALRSVMDEVETGLTLLGATAVEDLLQDGVQETLESLSIAGVKVWVLTGDKVETAVNIAFLCGLFKKFMNLIYLTHLDGEEGARMKLEESAEELKNKDTNFGLIVDGATLILLMERFREMFYHVCKQCSAVICCRMSPKQKAEIVRLVKTCSKKRTVCAAVGDGANDVSMIQEAHIGLGIIGKEGRQAVLCSDFALARFKFLQKAILVHGHWYYTRVSTLIQYSFYKNITLSTPQIFFAVQSAFSTQTVFDSLLLTLFNTTFTSLPIIIFGLFEQVHSEKDLLSKPYLYRQIRNNRNMSQSLFILWGLQGLWHAVVLYYGLLAATINTVYIPVGKPQDFYVFSVMLATHIVFVVTLKLLVESKFQTAIFIGSIILSLFGFYVAYFIFCAFPKQAIYWAFYVFHGTARFYFTLIILVTLCLLPDVLIKIFSNTKNFSLRDEMKRLINNFMIVIRLFVSRLRILLACRI